MIKRCSWVEGKSKLYQDYHDLEWGSLKTDDAYLFEMLLLESFHAGLSWECVLNKRKYFKEAYDNFDYKKISKYNDKKINELLNNKLIIRNKLKVKASIKNAQIYIDIINEYQNFYNYLKTFIGNEIIIEKGLTHSPISDAISKDLYNKGMRFVGTIIIYSYLQAVGIINSHENCYLEIK